MTSEWRIHKFGGSSVADADAFRRVAGIVEGLEGRVGIVVSAMGGMTDALLRLLVLAQAGDRAFEDELSVIAGRYEATARALLDAPEPVLAAFEAERRDLRSRLDALAAGQPIPHTTQVVPVLGERWSSRLLAALLGGRRVDAAEIITVRKSELGPTVLWAESQARFDARVDPSFEGVTVFPGFVARTAEGRPTTLGRNGSDYSAAILAALADAAELTIWTDVDGVLSADPRRVPEAKVIDALTYDEAMELAYFGAEVLHPKTLGPVVGRRIPVWVRNSRRPERPGSRIGPGPGTSDVKGVTSVGGLALLNLEGSGMVGVPGTARRLFAALEAAGISVTLISQASSEHSICAAVQASDAERAAAVVRAAFARELGTGQLQRVEVTEEQSILAVVGAGMVGRPGIASRFFGSLGRAGINVRAIAQGSSEKNISAVVESADATRALRAVHSSFTLSAKTLSIGLIGPGGVGAALLRQLADRAPTLLAERGLDLRVRAIATSTRMLLGEPSLDPAGWAAAFEADAVPFDGEAFEAHVDPDHLPHAVMVDCTASEAVAARYAAWLAAGVHVITPNKKAFSGPLERYRAIRERVREGRAQCFYETTVGAALPIVGTLRDLLETGDEVTRIEGIFSGTLAYLFNVWDGSRPFSEVLRKAHEIGYTEPDPRDDLSGMDVARKLTILAREMGRPLEVGTFGVESLVPEPLREVSLEAFLARLPEMDEALAARLSAAQDRGRRLRYVGRLDVDGGASVGLQEVDDAHPFAHIAMTDNIVRFETRRYVDAPLVVQGPGAGRALTAGGVFADLLRLAGYLAR
jgi:aspartokinase/homoserine dehydrogenase 1